MASQMRLWHTAPFIRYIVALAAGILLQWTYNLPLAVLLSVVAAAFLAVFSYSYLSITNKYRLRFLQGVAVNAMVCSLGGALTVLHDVRSNTEWLGHREHDGYVVSVDEPITEKENSYKATAKVTHTKDGQRTTTATGKIILYFKKDAANATINFGDVLFFSKQPQSIRNSGNPAAFDYQRYCLFQGITHQVFLSSADYKVLPATSGSWFWKFIYHTRTWVITHLRRYISGKPQQGLAEAILIGYKNDLDRDMVQSYSNTGVVHIIAISGLHLGLIYSILLIGTRPLKRRGLKWGRVVLIICGLWLFSILAGAQPSVLRSALMFSFVAVAEVLSRKTSVYNTLALSAFILLCYNPFYLWDVGFQLSYAAVVSIVTFFRPISNWFTPNNKAVAFFWKVIAVTIAAQIFTLPISIYHFHQAPMLFIVSNLVAVPLGSAILISEVILCGFAWLPAVCKFIGGLLTSAISFLNQYILAVDSWSLSVWNGLSISTTQVLLLLLFAGTLSFWLLEKQKHLLWIATVSVVCFYLVRVQSFIEADQQSKLIVYNVPRHCAIDVINGRSYSFIGDSLLLKDGFLRNFHLLPSRVSHRVTYDHQIPAHSSQLQINNRHILVVAESNTRLAPNINIDLLVLSGNPKIYINKLVQGADVKQVVIDGSVPQWKSKLWQRGCDSLRIPCYNVSEKGAFVMNLR